MLKFLWKIPTDFHDNRLWESVDSGNIPQHNKAIYSSPGANITIIGKKTKTFLLKSGPSQGCLCSLCLFNILLEFLVRSVRLSKNIKKLQIKKKESKIKVYAEYMRQYICDSKNYSTESLQLNHS